MTQQSHANTIRQEFNMVGCISAFVPIPQGKRIGIERDWDPFQFKLQTI